MRGRTWEHRSGQYDWRIIRRARASDAHGPTSIDSGCRHYAPTRWVACRSTSTVLRQAWCEHTRGSSSRLFAGDGEGSAALRPVTHISWLVIDRRGTARPKCPRKPSPVFSGGSRARQKVVSRHFWLPAALFESSACSAKGRHEAGRMGITPAGPMRLRISVNPRPTRRPAARKGCSESPKAV